jgi:hypothetical protein
VLRRTVEAPDFAGAAGKLGVTPAFLPAAEFAALIAGEDALQARLVHAIGLGK